MARRALFGQLQSISDLEKPPVSSRSRLAVG
jgi:hypothetical protein